MLGVAVMITVWHLRGVGGDDKGEDGHSDGVDGVGDGGGDGDGNGGGDGDGNNGGDGGCRTRGDALVVVPMEVTLDFPGTGLEV